VGSSVTFTVKDAGVTITSSVATAALNSEFTISGTSQPFERVRLMLTKGNNTSVNWQIGKGDYKAQTYDLAAGDTAGGHFWCLIPGTGTYTSCVIETATKDGKYSIVPKINRSGTYEFTADLIDQTGISNVSVSVKVEEVKVTVTTEKTQYITGDKVKIKGTTTAGDYITIAIAGKLKWTTS